METAEEQTPAAPVSDGASRARPEGPPDVEEVLESARRDGIGLLIGLV